MTLLKPLPILMSIITIGLQIHERLLQRGLPEPRNFAKDTLGNLSEGYTLC